MIEYEVGDYFNGSSIISTHRHGDNVTLIRNGRNSSTFKLGRNDPVYSVDGRVSFLKKGDQNYLVQLKSTDKSNGSIILLHDISTKDEDRYEEGVKIEPKKTEMPVEFASLQSAEHHRILPLDNQGRCAFMYQDKQQ